MSWYCNAYLEIMDTNGKWYMVKKDELVRDANFYLMSWTFDGDPVDIDWLEDSRYEDLSEELRNKFSEAPNQQCYKFAMVSDLRAKCFEIIKAAMAKEYAAFRALGFDCELTNDGTEIEFSYKFRNYKHTGPCTYPVDSSLILDLRDALEKKDIAERLLGVLDTLEDPKDGIQFIKRIVFVRTF